MRISFLILSLILTIPLLSQSGQKDQIPVAQKDWLIATPELNSSIYQDGQRELIISNGLISRTFRLIPDAATVSLSNLVTGEEYIRSVKPEAMVSIDGISYAVGGLSGQNERGYLKYEWLDDMEPIENAFEFQHVTIREMQPPFYWDQVRWIPSSQWKREGKEVTFTYLHQDQKLAGVSVEVHYEIYDHLPLISKWIVVNNKGDHSIRINHFTSEVIAHPEQNNYVDVPDRWDLPNLYLENDYAFGGFTYLESPNIAE